MGCNCGKPKCDGHCNASPAVLQINNPSECVLFHKVEIPASMGNEITIPPEPGLYKNVLLYYEATGNAYFYSSDGIPTPISYTDYVRLTNKPSINGVVLIGNKTSEELGIPSADILAAETADRESADRNLQSQITQNATDITSLSTTKADKSELPTKTSDLTNDSGYQTATEVQSAINAATAGKQDTLTAGSNISISGNIISATDTTYTAGNGLDLTGTVFSVDTDVVATQSDLANVTSYITDATEYSASATYAVGDYAIHNGAIYQCNIAIVGGEAWDASHWDVVPSLQEQLDNTETWTFELEGGTTVTKKVVVR